MKHIILEFAEVPQQEDIDFSVVEYHETLNLNVFKGTTIPAVNFAQQATQTDTKAWGDVTDSDRDQNHISRLIAGTATHTFVSNEPSDSDRNFRDITVLGSTQTITETVEATDADN